MNIVLTLGNNTIVIFPEDSNLNRQIEIHKTVCDISKS